MGSGSLPRQNLSEGQIHLLEMVCRAGSAGVRLHDLRFCRTMGGDRKRYAAVLQFQTEKSLGHLGILVVIVFCAVHPRIGAWLDMQTLWRARAPDGIQPVVPDAGFLHRRD